MKKLLSLLLALSMLTIPFASMAEEEKVLNIFSWDGYIDYETVIKPFEQETGIKVNYAPFSTNEEMLKKLQENGASEYDVVLASDYILNTARQEGLMQKLNKDLIPNYQNLNPEFTSQYFDPDNEYVAPYMSGIPLIIYNPDLVDIEIDGFEDLWDPSLKDSLGLIDDARVTIGMVLLSMGQSMNTTDDAVLAEAKESSSPSATTFTCSSTKTCTTRSSPATSPWPIPSRPLWRWRWTRTPTSRWSGRRKAWALASTVYSFRRTPRMPGTPTPSSTTCWTARSPRPARSGSTTARPMPPLRTSCPMPTGKTPCSAAFLTA